MHLIFKEKATRELPQDALGKKLVILCERKLGSQDKSKIAYNITVLCMHVGIVFF